jgi:hypothetical protein
MFQRIIVGAIALLLSVYSITACEVCGGGGGGLQLGAYPQFDRHFIGLRYQYQGFDTDHGIREQFVSTGETYHTVGLWMRFAIGDRWQLFASLPYQHSTKVETYGTFNTSGVGDLSLLGLYTLIDEQAVGRFTHTLQVGGGVKLPLGSTGYVNDFGEWYPGLQNGSGSVDALINLVYIVRRDAWGLSVEESLQRSGSNHSADFSFGNRSTTTARIFRIFTDEASTRSIIPFVGASLQVMGVDTYQGEEYSPSGGHAMSAQVGVDVVTPRWSFGASVNPTIFQDQADGLISRAGNVTAQAIHFF